MPKGEKIITIMIADRNWFSMITTAAATSTADVAIITTKQFLYIVDDNVRMR